MARRKKQNEEEPKDDNINNESDDTFGLPEIEYEPLNRDEPQAAETSAETSYSAQEETRFEPVEEPEEVREEFIEERHEDTMNYAYLDEEEKSPVWPKVLGVLLLILVAAGALWFMLIYRPQQEEARKVAQQEEQARQEATRKKEADRIAELRRQEAEQRRLDSLANAQGKEGVLETLSGRTGRYYVVVASGIDDDLLHDFALKLVKNGTSCKLIPPFGKTKFSRLAVDVKDTYADAQATADGMKGGDFGDQIWVVKY